MMSESMLAPVMRSAENMNSSVPFSVPALHFAVEVADSSPYLRAATSLRVKG